MIFYTFTTKINFFYKFSQTNIQQKPFLSDHKYMNNLFNPILKKLFIAVISVLLFSCKTIPQKESEKQNAIQQKEPLKISRNLTEQGQLNAIQLAGFFLSQTNKEQSAPQNTQTSANQVQNNFSAPDINEILNFAADYISEAHSENINSDVAFAQMCLETGFLKFGGLVQPEWHNYCGLGAMDKDHPGERFQTRGLGIRAHIQHLQAYATTEETPLKNQLIDPRYNWVHKTKFTKDIYGLTGTWATDPQYSKKLDAILTRMEEFVNK